jgi:hypothetical protein
LYLFFTLNLSVKPCNVCVVRKKHTYYQSIIVIWLTVRLWPGRLEYAQALLALDCVKVMYFYTVIVFDDLELAQIISLNQQMAVAIVRVAPSRDFIHLAPAH